MISYPSVIDAVGSYDPSTQLTTVMAMVNNYGENGYIITNLFDSETHILKDETEKCLNTKVGLSYKIMLEFVGVTDFIDITVGNCKKEETCNPPHCSLVKITSELRDMPVYMANYMTPSPVSDVEVIPGDGCLTFTWKRCSNLFGYYLILTDQLSNIVESGYLPSNVGTYIFSNLINGMQYTLSIYNVNQSNIPSAETTKIAIPSVSGMQLSMYSIPGGDRTGAIILGVLGVGTLLYLVTRK